MSAVEANMDTMWSWLLTYQIKSNVGMCALYLSMHLHKIKCKLWKKNFNEQKEVNENS